MPLEFALRPRIRLREDPAPRAPRRRSRLRVPRFALPAAAYWAAVGGICYGIIRLHDAPPEAAAETRELAAEPEAPSSAAPASFAAVVQSLPVHEAEPREAPPQEPPAAANPELRAELEDAPMPPARTRALGSDVSAALLASQPPHAERDGAAPRASLGPHLDAAEEQPLARLDSPPTNTAEPRPAAARAGGSSLPSCEAAAAAAVQDLDFASNDRTADLPSEAIAGVLENGVWLSSCAVPSSTKLDVCVAIKGGRVTAATVTSRPSDPALDACVKQRAAALQFPYSTRVDVARTRF